MMSRRTLVTLAAASMMLVFGPAHAADTLRVGMDPLYEPFSFQTPDGKLTGFDHDISAALCEAINVTCDIQAIPYEGAFAALESGKIDTLINTYAMTKERLEKYAMVGPYIKPSYRLMTVAESGLDGTEATMKGKSLGVEKGTSMARYAQEKFGPFMAVTEYDQITQAIQDLEAGRVDAVFGDETQFTYSTIKKKPDGFKLVGDRIRDESYFGQGAGFILNKSDESWPPRLKEALDKIVASGKYKDISEKWFGRNLLGE